MSKSNRALIQEEALLVEARRLLESAPAWKWFQFLSDVQSKVSIAAYESENLLDKMIAESVAHRAEMLSNFFEALQCLQDAEVKLDVHTK